MGQEGATLKTFIDGPPFMLHLQFIWPSNVLWVINLSEQYICLDLRLVVCGLELLGNTSVI